MNDHRLLAIVTALLVENRVDKVNSMFLPKYNKLSETSQFTFSMKIRLLESLDFIPPSITQAAHYLRDIRNEFAHNLEKTDFAHLKEGKLHKFLQLSHQVYQYAGEHSDDRDDLLKSYKKLSFFCITGLHSYAGNIKLLRDEISKEEFISVLENISHKRFKDLQEFIERVMHGNPVITEIKDNNKYETFEGVELFPDGVVKVTPISEETDESE